MKNCELLDRYRDGELSDSQAEEFRRHLLDCETCGTTCALLDNIVSVMRNEVVPTTDMADRIARQAFQRISSWDGLLAYWFRPGFAFTTACLSIALCVFIWFAPEGQLNDYTAYEMFLDQAEASDPASELLAVSDGDFALVLLQGGDIQ